MYIQNITFFAPEENVPSLLQKIRAEIIPALMSHISHDANVRLSEVEIPAGHPEDALRSISLQFEFPSREVLNKWQADALAPTAENLHEEMGDDGLVFATVLKVLDI